MQLTTQQKLEKIREKVILANNPECKTYEEALHKELKDEDNCLILSFNHTNLDGSQPCILRYSDYEYKYDDKDGSCKILGLPLTLERVLVALNKFNQKNGFYITCAKAIHFVHGDNYSYIKGICEWQANQTLDNQDKAIDELYNVFFNHD